VHVGLVRHDPAAGQDLEPTLLHQLLEALSLDLGSML
jgi:hypothetical protein